MKLSLFTKVGMAVVGLALVVWVVLMLTTSETTKTGPVAVDGTHCPVCGRELPPSAQGTGECPYCEMEKRLGTYKGPNKTARPFPVVPVVLITAFVALLGVHLFVTVRRRVVKPQEEVLYHLSCPKCGRKLRYRQSQIGKVARCPLCHRPLVFPKPPGLPPPGRWGQMRRWLKLA